ncbi:MAG: hypothetical protein L6V85_08265 [Clostridiales bacterium]|nr:MAG: hypothetical protein L6V85_08265 [Clostridiales bacterium]
MVDTVLIIDSGQSNSLSTTAMPTDDCLSQKSHPAVLDGFIRNYRKYVKEFKEELDKEEENKTMSGNTKDYTQTTARGDKVVNIVKDSMGRNIAIIDRSARANKDYVVAIGYHPETGDWEQGRYGF